MKARSGPDHPQWKGGKTVTADGYVRITAGLDRHKYEHRKISEGIWGGELPSNVEVHHMDGRRGHNCVGDWKTGHPGNLLLIEEALHQRRKNSRTRRDWKW